MIKEWIESDNSFKTRIIGKLLGDGCITIQKGRKPRFQYTHTYTDLGWSQYCYTMLRNHIPINPPKYKKTIDSRLNKGYSQAYFVQSKTSPIITFLRSSWYISSRKVIPVDLIENHFDIESLAWWYMDDGHLKIKNNKPQKIILSTESFTVEENQWLKSYLNVKFNLSFSLDKQNRLIMYDQMQIYYFLYLVTPYLHESMHRKIFNSCNNMNIIPSRRTTLYISSSKTLKSPTKEINHVLTNLTTLIKKYKYESFYKEYYSKLLKYDSKKTKDYQIKLNKSNTTNLQFLQENTGLTYSQLADLCLHIKNEKSIK